MKNLVYISTVDMNSKVYMGVAKKISMQCEAFKQLGFQVYNLSNDKNNFCEKIKKILPNYYAESYRIIKKKIETLDTIDVCYIRYACASKGLIDVLKTIRKMHSRCKIIIEIPTFPYKQEMKSLKSKPQYFRDIIYRGKLKEYVDLIVTFSQYNSIYGIPVAEITNGIGIDTIKRRSPKKYNNKALTIIGVAGMQEWHGFDRIIKALHKYYQKGNVDIMVTLLVVGEGPCKEKWEKLANKYNLNDYVRFLGAKTSNELDVLYDEADLGIGSLGLHRMMRYPRVSVLKTREYCAKGLPFITTENDYIFNGKEFSFSYIVSDDEKEIDLNDIIKFSNRIYTIEPEIVASKMREFAEEHLQWCKILKPLVAPEI